VDDLRGCSVLIVDDVTENLRQLAAVLRRAGLVPRPATCGRLAIEAAASDPPDLVLMDVGMPGMSGLSVCRWFKQDERLRRIPVIFLSGHQGIDDKVEAFRAGGVDYVTKPFLEAEVVERVKTHLRLSRLQAEQSSYALLLEQRNAEQVRAVAASELASVFALAKLAEARDDDTGHHIERVQFFSRALAEKMGEMKLQVEHLTSAFIDNLHQTASLHDIGKVGTPDSILLKPGKLTTEEFAVMKTHCALGASTLSALLERYPGNPFFRMGVEVARSHHERWDGGGYPDGLQGRAIPLAARIVAVADYYDALASRRCYRPAFSHEETCRMIRDGSATHFDPDVVAAFQAVEPEFQRIRHEMQDR